MGLSVAFARFAPSRPSSQRVSMRVADPNRGQQILDTAARLFDKRRYHELRMEDVAAQAGVAKGTLYRYFHDKEDLYIALLLSALRRLYEELKSAFAAT